MPVLAIAGPGEFVADRFAPPRQAYDARLLAAVQSAAYTDTAWDCIYVSPKADAWLRENGSALPAKGILVTDAPLSLFFPFGGKTVAVILLPLGKNEDGTPTAEQIEDAVDAGRDVNGRADLTIAVSPWGMHAELAHAARFEGLFHILLGGGQGMGISPQAIHDAPSVLWTRSESLGHSLATIDILRWPDLMFPTAWAESANFTWREIPLGMSMEEDPTVRDRIAAFPQDVN